MELILESQPLISVIMPSLNQAEFLEQAIESVLGQNHSRIELIVIDGGSTDGSRAIIERYDQSIAFWVSEPDRGQSDALNKGFRQATGDILGWLNSDDTYTPNALNEAASVFQDPDVNIAMCRTFAFTDATGNVISTMENEYAGREGLIRFWRTDGPRVNQPSIFFRRRLIDELALEANLDLHFAMDYDLWLRISMHYPIHVVEGHWANYRFHERSKTIASTDRFLPEWIKVSRRHWGKTGSWQWLKHGCSYLYFRYPRRYLRAVFRRIGIDVLD